MSYQPLVTCIMPTANRKKFRTISIHNFLQQDYSNAELIIIDDGVEPYLDLIPNHPKVHFHYSSESLGTIGIKRNIACEKAKGEIIMHWDDDDWYELDWISRQVNALETSGADITGLNHIKYFSMLTEQSFFYQNSDAIKPWLCGATLAYRKSLWYKYHFVDLQVGEDSDFLLNSGGTIYTLNYPAGFMAVIHSTNTSIKQLDNINPVGWQLRHF